MNRQDAHTRSRLPVGATAALAAILLAPAVTRAGCGDDLVIGHRNGPRPAEHTPARQDPACDCKGPSCSAAPAAPAPSRSIPPSGRVPDWAVQGSATDAPGASLYTLIGDNSSVRASHRTTDVFHPPR
jgi:hypothetical protein